MNIPQARRHAPSIGWCARCIQVSEAFPDAPIEGRTYVLFESNSDELDRQDQRLLDQYVKYWRQHRDQRIWVIGYADSKGSKAHNWILTEDRARAAKDYLIELGVPSETIIAFAGGEDRSQSPHPALKRRVELHLVDSIVTRRALRPGGEK